MDTASTILLFIAVFVWFCILLAGLSLTSDHQDYYYENTDTEQIDSAERRARSLFRKSLPKQARIYAKNGYAWVESKLYEISYKVDCYGIDVYQVNHRTYLGGICIYPKNKDEIPEADSVLQLCLMLLSDEKQVLARGNWSDHGWTAESENSKALGALESLSKPIIKRRENGR